MSAVQLEGFGGPQSANWRRPAMLAYLGMAASMLLQFVLFFQDWSTLFNLWVVSETFNHCLVIPFISGYLFWLRRDEFDERLIRCSILGCIGIAGCMVIYLLGTLLSLQVLVHIALVSSLICIILGFLGWRLCWTFVFPLSYLLFMIPLGDELVPVLVEFTATFTVAALDVVGIPVFREGIYFDIPTGRFEVAKACSGVRYLIASLAVGFVYAYLFLQTFKTRAAFVVLAIVIPIIANGFRALGIVLLAHYSNMQLAVGVDHLIYGWIFFGFVMLLMFWIGDKMRERWPAPEASEGQGEGELVSPSGASLPRDSGVVLALTFAVFAGLPFVPGVLLAATPEAAQFRAAVPTAPPGWSQPETARLPWRMHYRNASAVLAAQYVDQQGDGGSVTLMLHHYTSHKQGEELIQGANRIADGERSFVIDQQQSIVEVDGTPVQVREHVVRSVYGQMLVWSWYQIDGEIHVANLPAKLTELDARIAGRSSLSSLVGIATPMRTMDARDASRSRLQRFRQQVGSAISTCAHDATARCVDWVVDPERN